MVTAAPLKGVRDGAGAASAGKLIRALNNPIRRSILRFLLEKDQASSTEIRGALTAPIGNNLNHHLDILSAAGAVTRETKRVGYRERFYSLDEAARTSWVLTALQETAAED